jgi:hypothetical protein
MTSLNPTSTKHVHWARFFNAFFCVKPQALFVGLVGEWVPGKVGLSMGGLECLVKVHGWGALVSVKGCNLFIY